MPSHSVHSALVQMFCDDESPWAYPEWQDITGVRHGLFPAEDALLPAGWSRADATFILSYFDQYGQKVKEDDKIKFSGARAGAAQVPGRDLWRKWVIEGWRSWKIHARITSVLSKENLYPLTIMLSSKTEVWPHGATWIPLAVDPVGRVLFGDDALDASGRVVSEMRMATQALIQRTWTNIYNQTQRSKARIINLEKEATDAFDSESLGPIRL